MPPDWIGPATALPEGYCAHVCSSRFIARLINAYHETSKDDVRLYNRLTIMQAREDSAITALARALRMTPRSRMDPKTAGRSMSAVRKNPPPWERKPPHRMGDDDE